MILNFKLQCFKPIFLEFLVLARPEQAKTKSVFVARQAIH